MLLVKINVQNHASIKVTLYKPVRCTLAYFMTAFEGALRIGYNSFVIHYAELENLNTLLNYMLNKRVITLDNIELYSDNKRLKLE